MTGPDDDLQPDQAQTPAEFLALLRKLKERSGHSYRELERRAAEQGYVLPRSTIADVMRRDALPGVDRLVAFVRACGAQDQLTRWLRARERLAAAATPSDRPAAGAPTPTPSPTPSARRSPATVADAQPPSATPVEHPPTAPPVEPPTAPLAPSTAVPAAGTADLPPASTGPAGTASHNPWRGAHLRPVLAAVVVGVLLVAVGWLLADGIGGRGGDPIHQAAANTTPTADPTPTGLPANLLGHVRIRPVSAPELCLTDGTVLDGRYHSLVAVHRFCGQVAPQTTVFQPTGSGTYRIVWEHPQFGVGCLVLLTEGPGVGLLEPWDDCSRGSHFSIEPARSYGDDTYVLRIPGSGCVGVAEPGDQAGAEAVTGPCEGRATQTYRLEPAPVIPDSRR